MKITSGWYKSSASLFPLPGNPSGNPPAGWVRMGLGRAGWGKKTIIVLVLLPFFAGCAARGPAVVGEREEPVESPPMEEARAAANAIELISVVGMGDGVLIEANGAAKYTAFKLTDPTRLVIDFPDVGVEGVTSPMDVNNNFITDIYASSYGEGEKKIGRIEIGLREGINYNIKGGEDSVLVEFSREIYLAEEVEEEVVEEEVVEEAPVEEVVEEAAAVPAPAPVEEAVVEEPEEAPLPPAKRITKIDAELEDDITIVSIVGDGQFGNYNSFGLDSPPRIVIDVWGVGSTVEKKELLLVGPFVKKIRLGTHPDKTRLVFDSIMSPLPVYSIVKKGNAIVVTFAAKDAGKPVKDVPQKVAPSPYIPPPTEPAPQVAGDEAREEAVKEAEEEREEGEEKAEETEAVAVKSVDFKKVNGQARLVIANTAKARYEITEGEDGMLLTLTIFNAAIPEELKMTLDATELNTPVSTISSYQATADTVAVLVRLDEAVPYKVNDTNSTIAIDFPVSLAKALKPKAKKEAVAGIEAAVEPIEAGLEEETKKEAIHIKKYTGKKISIDMIDTQITDLLKLLAEVDNINIITSDDVKGTITLRLKEVPSAQVFDLILQTKGLESVPPEYPPKEGNVIRVAPVEKIRKEREEKLAAKKAEQKLEDLQTEFIRINYDKAKELAEQVKSMLTDRHSITVHETTNTIVIKDVKSAIADAKAYIKKVDMQIPQVLIEARIVEADSSFARDLGIQWGADYITAGDKFHSGLFGTQAQTASIFADPAIQYGGVEGALSSEPGKTAKKDLSAYAGPTNYAVNLPATGTAGTLGALNLLLGKAGSSPLLLDLRLTAGEQDGVLKTISRPRIVTMNNKDAKIQQGESIPFETTSATGTQTTFIDANLSLTVTPQITPDGSVLMNIKASRNSIGTFRSAAGAPSINKKEAVTNVLVKDGETTVIGGIIISETNKSEKGIPFLKNVPVLGWLFKAKSVSDSQKELLIFITPTIMKEQVAG